MCFCNKIRARDTFYNSIDCICVASEMYLSRAAPLGAASLTARKVSDEWKEVCKIHALPSSSSEGQDIYLI